MMRLLSLFFASMFSTLVFTDAMARGNASAPEDGRSGTAWASLGLAVCGNGTPESGEDCDDGNTDPGDCCSPTCQYESAATECRPAAGICDAPDNCDGAGACTADAKLTSECRAAATVCDIAEVCDGVSDDCPPDLFLPAGTECRPATGVCDPAWFCDGVSPDCYPVIYPLPILCRASTGVCDPEERCAGMGSSCPPDIVFPPGTVCRASSGLCDIAEVCNEWADCPADFYEPPTTECRASAGGCDIAENCTGADGDCPADASITACIDDDSCCPDGCSAADDNDCLEVPALSLRGLTLCLLILAAGGIVLLRQRGASRSAKAVTSAVVIAFALAAVVGESAYRSQSPPGTKSCLATHQPAARAENG